MLLIVGAALALRPYTDGSDRECGRPVAELRAGPCAGGARLRAAAGVVAVLAGSAALVVWFRQSFLLRQELDEPSEGDDSAGGSTPSQ